MAHTTPKPSQPGRSTIWADINEHPKRSSNALGYVAAIGSGVVFLLHVWIVQRWSASRTAYVMLLVPFVTVVLSAWLDEERITAGLVMGGVLVIAGVYFGALRQTRSALVTSESGS